LYANNVPYLIPYLYCCKFSKFKSNKNPQYLKLWVLLWL
jgi:hypothetical protein